MLIEKSMACIIHFCPLSKDYIIKYGSVK